MALAIALRQARDAEGKHVILPAHLVFTPWVLEQFPMGLMETMGPKDGK